MTQLDLFTWAKARHTAEVIDLIPAIIRHICAQPYPTPKKDGKIVYLPDRRPAA